MFAGFNTLTNPVLLLYTREKGKQYVRDYYCLSSRRNSRAGIEKEIIF